MANPLTEEEWWTTELPERMIDVVGRFGRARGKAGRRRCRLFAVACLRRIEDLPDGLRAAVEVAEYCAEGRASPRDLENTREALLRCLPPERDARVEAVLALLMRRADHAARNTPLQVRGALWSDLESLEFPMFERGTRLYDEGVAQAHLFRDLFGNPFRPISFLPEWRTVDTVGLARVIYAERAFDRLPILADALQDAGCDQAALLDHCHLPGVHARGCWVVDHVLDQAGGL